MAAWRVTIPPIELEMKKAGSPKKWSAMSRIWSAQVSKVYNELGGNEVGDGLSL